VGSMTASTPGTCSGETCTKSPIVAASTPTVVPSGGGVTGAVGPSTAMGALSDAAMAEDASTSISSPDAGVVALPILVGLSGPAAGPPAIPPAVVAAWSTKSGSVPAVVEAALSTKLERSCLAASASLAFSRRFKASDSATSCCAKMPLACASQARQASSNSC
jgi:hypothetical protein